LCRDDFVTLSLEGPDRLHLRAAHGYIELGMFEQANTELEEIDPFCRHLPEVVVARLAIFHGLEKWELLAVVAKRLVEWNPKKPAFFVELAYGTRRAESIHAAHAVLTRAATGFLRTRFLSFAMVGGICFLLLVSLTLESVLRGFSHYVQSVMPGGIVVALVAYWIFDLGIVIFLFACIFKVLPNAKIQWRDAWVGATITAFLLPLASGR